MVLVKTLTSPAVPTQTVEQMATQEAHTAGIIMYTKTTKPIPATIQEQLTHTVQTVQQPSYFRHVQQTKPASQDPALTKISPATPTQTVEQMATQEAHTAGTIMYTKLT